jgi:hypothetical protein
MEGIVPPDLLRFTPGRIFRVADDDSARLSKVSSMPDKRGLGAG